MTTPFRIAELTFNGGVVVDTAGADIVVLVGPNNTGKSRTLQELLHHLSLHHGQAISPNEVFVLTDASLRKTMSGEELATWMRSHRYSWTHPSDGSEHVRTVNAGELALRGVAATWSLSGDRLHVMAAHLVRGLWCGERLNQLSMPSRLELGVHPDHPVHFLLQDESLMSGFRAAFRAAFGMNVIVDAWGTSVRLRLSSDETQSDFTTTTADGLPTREVVERLSALPVIEAQSDGVRSFAGILLTLLAAQYPLILLDEPEAFLHPPQARLLGRFLAQMQREGQLFVATHSLDVLLGLVESRPEKVQIVRLTRENGLTSAQTLAPERLAELWRDPFLRFSRALDGLFHDGVVVCEGDTDSQFYSGIASVDTANGRAEGRHIMFTYAGSKHRIPLITNALRAVGVPVRAIVDFDALSDAGILKSLVNGVGCEYTLDMEGDRRIVAAHLRGSEGKLTVGALRETLTTLLGNDPDREVTRTLVGEVRQALEPETGWRAAKKSGRNAVPAGDATVALDRLLSLLARSGVFVVPSGAVESFVKAVGGKGPRWAVAVAEGGHMADAHEAHAFVRAVLDSLPGTR